MMLDTQPTTAFSQGDWVRLSQKLSTANQDELHSVFSH